MDDLTKEIARMLSGTEKMKKQRIEVTGCNDCPLKETQWHEGDSSCNITGDYVDVGMPFPDQCPLKKEDIWITKKS